MLQSDDLFNECQRLSVLMCAGAGTQAVGKKVRCGGRSILRVVELRTTLWLEHVLLYPLLPMNGSLREGNAVCAIGLGVGFHLRARLQTGS